MRYLFKAMDMYANSILKLGICSLSKLANKAVVNWTGIVTILLKKLISYKKELK